MTSISDSTNATASNHSWTAKPSYDKVPIKLLLLLLQEQKKKELEELNAMLTEMGVAPKEAESDAGGTAPSGKKKKKKDKAAVKENAATAVNGNGVAPNEQPKAEQPSSEETQDSIEVLIALFANLHQQPCCMHAGCCCCAPASQVCSCRVLLECCILEIFHCTTLLSDSASTTGTYQVCL